MVVHQPVDVETLGRRYAQEVRNEPGVRELWVRRIRNDVDLWLITDSVDSDAECRLYGASGVLYRDFPDVYIRVHLLKPDSFPQEVDLRSLIPQGSVQIPLRDGLPVKESPTTAIDPIESILQRRVTDVYPPVDAQTLGRRYAQEVQHLPGIRELWAWPHRDSVRLWLITDPLDHEAELRLYGAAGVLYRDFPDAYFEFHLLHPDMFEAGTDLRSLIPDMAQSIPLDDQ